MNERPEWAKYEMLSDRQIRYFDELPEDHTFLFVILDDTKPLEDEDETLEDEDETLDDIVILKDGRKAIKFTIAEIKQNFAMLLMISDLDEPPILPINLREARDLRDFSKYHAEHHDTMWNDPNTRIMSNFDYNFFKNAQYPHLNRAYYISEFVSNDIMKEIVLKFVANRIEKLKTPDDIRAWMGLPPLSRPAVVNHPSFTEIIESMSNPPEFNYPQMQRSPTKAVLGLEPASSYRPPLGSAVASPSQPLLGSAVASSSRPPLGSTAAAPSLARLGSTASPSYLVPLGSRVASSSRPPLGSTAAAPSLAPLGSAASPSYLVPLGSRVASSSRPPLGSTAAAPSLAPLGSTAAPSYMPPLGSRVASSSRPPLGSTAAAPSYMPPLGSRVASSSRPPLGSTAAAPSLAPLGSTAAPSYMPPLGSRVASSSRPPLGSTAAAPSLAPLGSTAAPSYVVPLGSRVASSSRPPLGSTAAPSLAQPKLGALSSRPASPPRSTPVSKYTQEKMALLE